MAHSGAGSGAASGKVPPVHRLHSGYGHEVLRSWNGASAVAKAQLVYPLFVEEDDFAQTSITSMPGQYRWGVKRLAHALAEPVRRGLQAVLVFGVVTDDGSKDARGSLADADHGPAVRAVKALRELFPSLLIITDVCLCPYTNHGHCGIVRPDFSIQNEQSIERLAEISVAYARAGAHVVAPSDMMDGRVAVIKDHLRAAGLDHVTVMSYAAKYKSCFYGGV